MRTQREIRVQSLKNQAVIADKCQVADRYFIRLRGLIGSRGLASGEGMYFPRNNSIHMWFMGFPIDVVFVQKTKGMGGDLRLRITSIHSSVRPWRVLPLTDFSATDTLELPAGTIARTGLQTGDELCIS